MAKTESKMPLPKLDDLFTTEEERGTAKLEKVVEISIKDIDDFPNHPFKVIENEDMYNMRDSIIENGILVPVLVRPKSNGRYEMVSGHRRKYASKLANIETIPCIVRDLSDDEAIIIMVDSNLQREEVLPSEKAFAYKMKLEAISHQGKRNDLTSSQLATKLDTATIIGKENRDSRDTVYRYIRLTELIPELLDMVDEKQIAFLPAVELSYLKENEQYSLLDSIEYNDATPSLSQAIVLKKLSQERNLDEDKIDDILSQEKPNQIPKLKVSMNRLSNILPSTLKNDKEREDYVIKAVEWYDKYQKKIKALNTKER